MTTRRYPRSLIEAWPHHYPHSITRHKRPLAALIAGGIVAITLHSLGAL